MALSDRQQKLYTHQMDVWRFTVPIAADGKPGARTWTKVAAAVPCYVKFTESQHAIDAFMLGEADNIFTLDVVSFEAGRDVRSGDVLKMLVGPAVGVTWTVRGGDKPKVRRANKLSVRASRNEAPPSGVV